MSRNYESVYTLTNYRNSMLDFYTNNPNAQRVNFAVVNGIVLPSVAAAASRQGLHLTRVGKAWTIEL